MRNLFLETALLPDGWARDVLVACNAAGRITAVTPGATPPADAERLQGTAIPGVPNLHSHAHQRAIAGLGERAGTAEDSFWTWREAMYRAVVRFDPDLLQAVATQLYIEMLKAGFTSAGEFHYLHHDRGGAPFADPAEMSHRIVAAARTAGIRLTLLPVLYAAGGFGQPASQAQARFIHTPDAFARLMQALHAVCAHDPMVTLGIAPHSLRAVPADMLAALVATTPAGPIHIHVAEQRAEVDACLAHTGRRPVQWLLDHLPIDARWCLIHATHVTEAEVAGMAQAGATVCVCPTTEASLGDGIFPAASFRTAGGRIGIGSDSNATVSATEELRWLEYVQRLATGRRTVLADPGQSNGQALLAGAWASGAAALDPQLGRIAPGAHADFLVLDDAGVAEPDDLLDQCIFGSRPGFAREVIVGGRIVVRDGHHDEEQEAAHRYTEAHRLLMA